MDQPWKKVLSQYEWEEGKVIHLPQSTYRNRPVIVCYSQGRQTAEFQNGPGKYAAFVELMRPDGTPITWGNVVVPVLPDGRLILIVEQRPPQGMFKEHLATHFLCGGQRLAFDRFGPYSSLEFPGGAVEAHQEFRNAFMNELREETGVPDQPAELWRSRPPFFQTGADLALAQQTCVIYLTNLKHDHYVQDDGGLTVLALTEEEVQENIWSGAIVSGQAGHRAWGFYNEVKHARTDPEFRRKLEKYRYLEVENVIVHRA